tara:strand:- start:16 stop:213 length:198 start_codon:yes stop_codon:yes gene_type:complete
LVICFLPYCWVFGEFILQTFQLCAADFHDRFLCKVSFEIARPLFWDSSLDQIGFQDYWLFKAIPF